MIVVVGNKDDLDYVRSMRFCQRQHDRAVATHFSLRTPREPDQTDISNRSEEGMMVVLVTQEFQGVSREDAEEVGKRLRAREIQPAGLIAHVLTEIPGGIRSTDIWESEADFKTLAKEQLMPLAGAFAEERGLSMDGISDPMFAEAFDVDAPGR